MNRGFGAVFVIVILAALGGIVWWALRQDTTVTAPSGQAQGIPVVFNYSANKTEFPSSIFKITDDTRILGANYIHARNTAEIVYSVLGKSAGITLSGSCHFEVNASIEIANPKLDNASYADIDPTPTVAVADVTRVISHGEPRQVCTTP